MYEEFEATHELLNVIGRAPVVHSSLQKVQFRFGQHK